LIFHKNHFLLNLILYSIFAFFAINKTNFPILAKILFFRKTKKAKSIGSHPMDLSFDTL